MNYLNELNEKQKEAVLQQNGPVLILAGAGAGKTKTIISRIMHLIKSGIEPRQILAITFTNKAAKEMKDRIEKSLFENANTNNINIQYDKKPFISTFHSLGVFIIKENAELLGLNRHFNIFDRDDSLRTIKNAIKESDLNIKDFEPKKILNIISSEKGNANSIEKFSENAGNNYFRQIVAGIWLKYENTLKKEKALDFDDLLLKTVFILEKYKEIKLKYQNIWKYIHIDEYQDTNAIQYRMARLLVNEEKNICVVGDIDQTIYSWRGADIAHIMRFEKDFSGAKTILLEENYRSTKTIISAANQIIKKNKIRVEKNLFTNNEKGESIELIANISEKDEAEFISKTCKELMAKKIEPRNIAVLYRANFQSRILEEFMINKKIPYQVIGIRFFERKEIKDILSYIKASLNTESLSDMKRIINVPARGIGKNTLLKVFSGQEENLPLNMKLKLSSFREMLKNIKEASFTLAPSELIKFVIKKTGIEKELSEGTDEEKERLENIRELATLAVKYDTFPIGEGIEKLLEEASLASDQDELSKDNNAIKLMTVHASKGLEFDYVFISGMEEGLFPHKKINEKYLSENEKEEERRLFYVAITRARKKIWLSYAETRTIFGSMEFNTPSNFIKDIDDSLLKIQISENKTEKKKEYLNLDDFDDSETTVYI